MSTNKFIHQVSRSISCQQLNQIKPEILEPKLPTTLYLNKVRSLLDITSLPKFSFLKYKG